MIGSLHARPAGKRAPLRPVPAAAPTLAREPLGATLSAIRSGGVVVLCRCEKSCRVLVPRGQLGLKTLQSAAWLHQLSIEGVDVHVWGRRVFAGHRGARENVSQGSCLAFVAPDIRRVAGFLVVRY